MTHRSIQDLKPWPDNYNKGDIRAIARSILMFGFNSALRVWQDGVVMAGNHSLLALRLLCEMGPDESIRQLLGEEVLAAVRANQRPALPWPPTHVEQSGGTWLAPTIDVTHLSRDQAIAYAIADNQTARLASQDPELLARYLSELLEHDLIAFQATGYSEDDLRELLAMVAPPSELPADPGPQTDRAQELLQKWKTERGQLWQIPSGTLPGSYHRLLCGDSTNAEDVLCVMEGARAQLFATDPPYLVDYDGTNHPHKWGEPDKNKDWSESYHDWDSAAQGEALYDGFIAMAVQHAVEPNVAWYCWHASRNQAMVERVWAKYGAFVHQQIIWVKDRPILTRSHYMWQHEPCLFGWVKGNKPSRYADDHPSTIWSFATIKPGETTDHPTSKPIPLFAIPMQQHTVRGDICYEPFAGSGSQIVAAEQLGRLVYGIELQPEFVAAILERVSLMGLTPQLVTS